MQMRVTMAALALGLGLGSAGAQERDAAPGDYVRPPAKEGYSYPECYCTDSQGDRVELGEYACLQIGSRQVYSRCEKRRNLVIWNHQSGGCPGV